MSQFLILEAEVSLSLKNKIYNLFGSPVDVKLFQTWMSLSFNYLQYCFCQKLSSPLPYPAGICIKVQDETKITSYYYVCYKHAFLLKEKLKI